MKLLTTGKGTWASLGKPSVTLLGQSFLLTQGRGVCAQGVAERKIKRRQLVGLSGDSQADASKASTFEQLG